MNTQYYPLIYTATRGLDYNLWLSPPEVNSLAVDICRRCMADDLYGMSHHAKRLYVKTSEFLLWGVSISNSMMIALDPYYYTDAFNRPIRGFYGAYIPLDSGIDIPKTLPLDFDEGLPFTQNMLFEPFVEPYWTVNSRSELNQTAMIQNLTMEDDDSLQGVSAFDASLNNPSFGYFYGLAPRSDEKLNGIIQSFVRSQKNVGIVTGVESLTQARDLAKLFNIQFIELANATEDSEIEIDPKPVCPPVVEPFESSYANEDESEDEEWESDFSSSTSFDIPASNRKNNINTSIFKFRNKSAKIHYNPEPLNNRTQRNSLAGNFSSGEDDNIDKDNEDMISSFFRYILNLWNSMWGTSPNESNDVQSVPPEKEEQPSETMTEQPEVFRQELSKSGGKPFVSARHIINPAFENRPDFAFSDDYDNNPKLLNNRFLPRDDNDENDPNNENDTF